ncbi:bifunctional diaminohydroxyphosphoribosylaminopyrimidine deaminase/5-amino-6-(5-phosphoribosylamino)uracil reductase RibD [Dictyobacter aurantiacus]|uniref:Riboflavin biosynthesis protein RibD n=1 Tax=Dictyobacter aurantiacus TaxID=1936993 RepID=A0A401ZPI2_9CHLR|nr:bifunctional diaminohydroxyphosphoribosylaminopyrimidine deaminase/5-amino-6-(5-phosphoribosylamino)uracil reductase RibD [Dictyobacter aurantiacus]GCE08720.1 riboflavin biosynthesis protein RibD [Dictyobacter aurantiacus]
MNDDNHNNNNTEFMAQALTRARSVIGRTSPRPPVGAVVVLDGTVVGAGATDPPFGPHAEVNALLQAGEMARGADLYVTLEPCCVAIHTPPCTHAILEAGIRRVVVATLDPNPLVAGRGMAQLREAGIEVVVGPGSAEAQEIIRPFSTFITRHRPHFSAKWAMTLDGKIATYTGDAYWISNDASRVWVHNFREEVDAIIIGSATARLDDPQLTVRLEPHQHWYPRTTRSGGPLRVIVSTHGDLPAHLKLLQPALAAGTCIIVGEGASPDNIDRLRSSGAEIIRAEVNQGGFIDMQTISSLLAEKGLMHVLLEGGSQLLGQAFDQRLIDQVAAFIAPRLIGGRAAPSPIGGTGLSMMKHALTLANQRSQIIDGDILIQGLIVYET